MKIFLAMAYSQLCDEKYKVKSEYKKFFTRLTDELKKLIVNISQHTKEKIGEKLIVQLWKALL